MKYKLTVFIFRRDLRLADNTGFIRALQLSEKVIPCFIFDKRQIGENILFNKNAFQFMLNSLSELDEDLRKHNSRLYLFSGLAEEIIGKLIDKLNPEAIFLNRDYTPFSIGRDNKIKELCEKRNIELCSCNDLLLTQPEDVMKEDKTPYRIFTHFYNKAKLITVDFPLNNKFVNYFTGDISFEEKDILNAYLKEYKNKDIRLQGGREEALKMIRKISKLSDYAESRNLLYVDGTTHLSAHLKFGNISVREVYFEILKTLGSESKLIPELYWRDFFTHVCYHFPFVLEKSFHRKYDNYKWDDDNKLFILWCEGKTGIPIIDAGMNELNTTGYMHNRVRMVVSSFLCKDLNIDWQKGEKYFAKKLIDYDPAVNNGNWQWASSTGCDSMPSFRKFSPLLQQKKYDPKFVYVKKWLPYLRDLKPKEIYAMYAEPAIFKV